ncbi:MAG: glycerophosphoryl diester phosphodiesterase membrane domain-containing protein [Thermoleophilia bacterium]|nr:glycerophosphoryl diester phosphodiesterase membrane domain-containing protein [Thermoleophilia bacterium]
MWRRLRLAAAAAAIAALLAPAALAATPEEDLAQTYAPVVRVQTQAEPCAEGEPYLPLDVDVLFANVEVAFRGPWDTVNLVKVAPTAAELGRGYPQYHLDFPGNALDAGCDYDQWAKRIAEGTEPTTYARVVTEAARPGKLALQYWFYYAFNDFNNKHEGDWEMIQLIFDAPDAEAALAAGPSEVGYSQHEGAERATWGESKLELVDATHPVVYPAVGSHANFFEPALYLGRSAAQGVGCDETLAPHSDLRPVVAVVPTGEAAYLARYPWLGYLGHWGEKQEAFYNGPTGPNLKTQWTQPITWAEESWRNASFAVPAAGVLGGSATDFFCGAIAAGSDLLTKAQLNPAPVLLGLAAIIALIAIAAIRTTWTPAPPLPAERRRAWGQLLVSSGSAYIHHAKTFLGLGLLYVPTAVVTAAVQALLFKLTRLDALVDSAGESNGFVVLLALLSGLVFYLITYVVVLAAVARALAALADGAPVGVIQTYRDVLGQIGPLARVTGWIALAVAVTIVWIVTLPITVYLLVRWAFAVQAVALEGHSGRAALSRSAELVRGNWWRTGVFTSIVTTVGAAAGPVVGILLLLGTTRSFFLINAISSLVYAVTIPFVALALTYLYYDLREREGEEPVQVTSSAPQTTS